MNQNIDQVYDRDYFIRFFEEIPHAFWLQNAMDGYDWEGNEMHCALGWVRARHLEKVTLPGINPNCSVAELALGRLFNPQEPSAGAEYVAKINDSSFNPKRAVIAALYQLPAAPVAVISVDIREALARIERKAPDQYLPVSYKTQVWADHESMDLCKKWQDSSGMWHMERIPAHKLGSLMLAGY